MGPDVVHNPGPHGPAIPPTPHRMSMTPRFWEHKTLEELTPREWEALCDGCAKCCLNKLEDEATGQIWYTNVACDLLDLDTCRCGDYPNRSRRVPDCVVLTPRKSRELKWMPETCAYRLLAEGRPLPDWHPLVSGDPRSLIHSHHRICGRVIHEREAGDLEHHLITWFR